MGEKIMDFEIYGYDDNWDLGGSHRSPRLCIVKANSKEQAEEFATSLSGFCSSWNGKGYVKEVNVIDLTENEALNNAVDVTFRGAVLRLAEKLKERIRDVAFISKDEIINWDILIDETSQKFLTCET